MKRALSCASLRAGLRSSNPSVTATCCGDFPAARGAEGCDAYDEFVDNGGPIEDASEVVMTALKNGGFIAKSAVEAAKKIQGQLLDRAAQGN